MVDTLQYFFVDCDTLQKILLSYDKLSERKVKYVITKANMLKIGNCIPVKLLGIFLKTDDFLSSAEIKELINDLLEVEI